MKKSGRGFGLFTEKRGVIGAALLMLLFFEGCASNNVPTQKLGEAVVLNGVDFKVIQLQSDMRSFWINSQDYYRLIDPEMQFVTVALRTEDGKKAQLDDLDKILVVASEKEYSPAVYVFYAYGNTIDFVRAGDYGSAKMGPLSQPLKLRNGGPYTIVLGYQLPIAEKSFQIVYKDIKITLAEEEMVLAPHNWDKIKE